MYTLEIRISVEKKLKKLKKRNRQAFIQIQKKITEILRNPTRYKNLRKPMQHLRRIHINSQYVLVFSVRGTVVIIEGFNHHDNAYQ